MTGITVPRDSEHTKQALGISSGATWRSRNRNGRNPAQPQGLFGLCNWGFGCKGGNNSWEMQLM